jgi:hypothetical protein
VLLDGHPDQLERVRATAKRHRVNVTIVLDLIHVLESLWKAAYVFYPEGSIEAEGWVTERLLWLLCGDAGQVIASIRRTATSRGLAAAARKPADTGADYIERYKAYTQYDAVPEGGTAHRDGRHRRRLPPRDPRQNGNHRGPVES